jgi:hypothetical protein
MAGLSFAKDVFSAIRESVAETLVEDPIDPTVILTVVAWFSAMLFFGVPAWKASAVAMIICIAITYNFGIRRIMQCGVLAMLLVLGVWIGAIPDPATWPDIAKAATTELRAPR